MGVKLNSVFKVTLLYLIFGVLWIFFSDKVLTLLVPDDILQLSLLQTIKGLFFIAFTGVLLYTLISWYNRELTSKVKMLQQSQRALTKSKENYRLLFNANPTPIFIYLPHSQEIVEVNNAALQYYGYSNNEFANMSILNIEDEEDIDVTLLEQKLHMLKRSDMLHTNGIHRHKRKDGTKMFVYMQSSIIPYGVNKAHIVMITDITHQLQYLETVEVQNKKLNNIAWMQSHVVRAPLASLMGLVNLLEENLCDAQEIKSIHHQIMNSAKEIDRIIKCISESSSPYA